MEHITTLKTYLNKVTFCSFKQSFPSAHRSQTLFTARVTFSDRASFLSQTVMSQAN